MVQHGRRLELVEEEIIDELQRQRLHRLVHRRRRQRDAHPPFPGRADQMLELADLVLHREHIALAEAAQHPVDLLAARAVVRAAEDKDAVIAIRVVLDDGVARAHAGQHVDMPGVHPGAVQLGQQETAVLPDGARKRHVEACARERDGLVEPLAAAEEAQFRTGEGLPPLHEMRHGVGIINIQRSEAQYFHARAPFHKKPIDRFHYRTAFPPAQGESVRRSLCGSAVSPFRAARRNWRLTMIVKEYRMVIVCP